MKESLAFKIGDIVYGLDSFNEAYGVVTSFWNDYLGNWYNVKSDDGEVIIFHQSKLTKETSMDRIMNKLKERGLYLTLYDDWSGDAIDFETSETVFSFGNKTQLKEKLFKRTIYHPISGKQVEISEESYQAMKKDWK